MSEHETSLTSHFIVAGLFNMPDAGWFLRLYGSYPVSVGMNKPPTAFRTGARIKLSVELVNETTSLDHGAQLSVADGGRSAGG